MSMQFSKDHYWVRLADTLDGHAIDSVVVGVTPRALDGLGNLISVILPNVGETLAQGAAAAEIESDKAVTNLYTPVSGEIIAVNAALRDTPTLANTDPLGAGWFFRVKLSNPGQLDALLDEKAYAELFWAP
ncbi:glycine cleavage system protein H [Pseudomonas aeruginosa]|nr:glycine cleavage system protein H [Pseudomonas aeruginosa]KKJ46967.1 glycine cleavage system protein H [Pseudomonas aeruginosa MRSN 317]KRU62139.1 glycine cleavage system protein H [Pseudomonas aeruginosa]KXC21118.1 glycine cleavage system protein H [Pseudomonas aeruginosa]KXC26578.1 glycine cleavage system protein H [Pseudomonas aeruginosa]